jgi:hypothetical protein
MSTSDTKIIWGYQIYRVRIFGLHPQLLTLSVTVDL